VTIDALVLEETWQEYYKRETNPKKKYKQGQFPSAFKQSELPYLLI